jgi:hypothetical protein
MMDRWIAMFSHTGSEIARLSERLGRPPDKIITNLSPGSTNISKNISGEITFANNKPTATDYRRLFNSGDFITMHGWMRVIPGSICREHNIYNLHPGLCTKYPELRGKDPQKRVFENTGTSGGGLKTYSTVGCVLHRAEAEVDFGRTVMERSTNNCYTGPSHLSEALKDMAVDMWEEFINYKLNGVCNASFPLEN